MKYIIYITTLIILVACTSQTETDPLEQAISKNSTEQINYDTIDPGIIDSTSIIIKNDLTEFGLLGKVESMSIHSHQVDEEGEQIGMGGNYEGYEFNELGFITTFEGQGCCGYDLERIDYKYDSDQNLTHRIFFNEGESDYFNKEKYFYNDNGLLVKIKIAGFDQKLDEEISLKYNENGKLIKKEIYNVSKDETETANYSYSDIKVIETYRDKNGDFDYKVVLIYDEKHSLIEREMHFNNGTIQQQQFTYEYDSLGNWITKMDKLRYILEDGSKEKWRKSTKETRSIKYYTK